MTNKLAIETENAPGAIGPYSQAVKVDNLLFTSGALPIDPATGKFPEGPIAGRTHQVLKNLSAVLEAAGIGFNDVVKTTVFLADMNDFQEVNEVYAQYFDKPFPARSAVQVAKLPLGSDIEIEAIAHIK